MQAVEPDRFFLDTFESASLVGNPLGLNTLRELKIYLPPGYHDGSRRYPVVYLLHGYGGDARHAIVESRDRLRREFPWFLRLVFRRLFKRVVTTERLDALITAGEIPPFVLVQPDGSLHLPHLTGGTQPGGDQKHKGSMYVDSRWTGKFLSSIMDDAVDYVDSTYRTLARKSSRAVIGGSMGGYGALLAGVFRPMRFAAVAALSPSICGLDVLDLKLYVPLLKWIKGETGAREDGVRDVADILDTCDLIFSDDRRLVPSIQRDPSGRAVSMDDAARRNWADWDAGHLARVTPGAFEDVAIRVSCEERDEFGFAAPDRRFCRDLEGMAVPFELDVFRDDHVARISPHTAGIAVQVEPALRFCLEHMVVSGT